MDCSHGLVSRVVVRGHEPVTRPWGFECSDSFRFFSAELSSGDRARKATAPCRIDGLPVNLVEGSGRLDVSAEKHVRGGRPGIRQHIRFVPTTALPVVDVVNRMRFSDAVFSRARIAGRLVQRDRSGYYHQYPVSEAFLHGAMTCSVRIEQLSCPESLVPVLYVRSLPGEWIVHARLLPASTSTEVVKLRGRPLPRVLNYLLTKSPVVCEILRYAGEFNRYPGSSSFQSFPLATLAAGQAIEVTTLVEFIDDRE